jgi:hypothetical protein
MKRLNTKMKYVVGLPYRIKSFRDNLMATCKLENVFEIDNTEKNIGFSASHNLGIQKMYDDGADWYIVMSAAVKFGEPGGLDFIKILKNTEHVIVEAMGVFGWHFIAFHKTLIDKVGLWDTNFTPYGYEDLDYSMRIQRAFLLDYDDKWEKIKENKTTWEKVKIDIKDTIMGHSHKLGGVDPGMGITKEYYNKKWGRYPSTNEDSYNSFFYPFNVPENGLKYFTNDYYDQWIANESKKQKLEFAEVMVVCLCGNSFKSMSVSGNLEVNTCAACDPSEFMQDGTKL